MVGLGLMQFPTCPQEALLLQHVFSLRPTFCFAKSCLALWAQFPSYNLVFLQDIAEAKDFFKHKGVDVGSDWYNRLVNDQTLE